MKHVIGIDLFCGCGGFSLGMIKGGIDVVLGIDNSPTALSTYYCNLAKLDAKWIGNQPSKHDIKHYHHGVFPPKHTYYESTKKWRTIRTVICDDIKKYSGKQLLKVAGVDRCDVLFGGPPCQGFSTSNPKRCVEDKRSQLMWEFIRLIGEVKPKFFIIENVPGLVMFKDFFYILLESLEQKGYVVRFNKLNACDYGVPQNRIRVFINGIRKDLNKIPEFPIPTHFDPELLKVDNPMRFCNAEIKKKLFKKNGFTKEEIKDIKWNTYFGLLTNKKTVIWDIDVAMGWALGENMKKFNVKDLLIMERNGRILYAENPDYKKNKGK